jgi:putative hydrolase of the HAD superfamily
MVSPSSRMRSNLPKANSLSLKGSLENRPGLILIDLDDTIITDDSVNQRCWDLVTQKYAPIIGKVSPAELLSIIQATTSVFWSDPENHRRGRLQLFQIRRELVAQALLKAGLADKDLGYKIADEYTV